MSSTATRRFTSTTLWVATLALLSCNLMMRPRGGSPEVADIAPSHRLKSSDPIRIRFSTPMDRESVEAGLTLAGPAGAVGGETNWKGKKKLVFRPAGIEPPSRYLLSLEGALSAQRVAMEEPYRHLYATIPDSAPPEVMEMIPENGAEGVEMSETIELLFSKAIDRSSLYSSLQIEPPLDVEYNWGEDDRRVELVPRSSLSAGTCYRVSVSRACTCSEGISLDEVHGASFTTVGEHGPDLTEILIRSEGTEREPDEAEVYEIEKDDLLTFSFAPPVPEAEHDSVIEFSAHADSSVEWSENGSSAELSFDEHLL